MFKKGDSVVCEYDKGTELVEGVVYKVSKVEPRWVFIEGFVGGFFSNRFSLAETKTPIWNNKKPADMTKEELKAFFCDRVDGVEMEYRHRVEGWLSSKDYGDSLQRISCIAYSNTYRIKPTKSEELLEAEKALEEAKAAVVSAQKAVKDLSKE